MLQHFGKASSVVGIHIRNAFEHARLRNSGIIPKLFMKFHHHEYILQKTRKKDTKSSARRKVDRKVFYTKINRPENILRPFILCLPIPSNEKFHYTVDNSAYDKRYTVNNSAYSKRRGNLRQYPPRRFSHKTAYTLPLGRWRRRRRRRRSRRQRERRKSSIRRNRRRHRRRRIKIPERQNINVRRKAWR